MTFCRFFSFVLVIFVCSARAERRGGLKDLVQDLQQTRETILEDEIRQRKILSQLFNINKSMKKVAEEKYKLEVEKSAVEASAEEIAQQIRETTQLNKTQKSLLRERLAAIYKFGGQGAARFLVSSANSAQLERNLKILGIVAKRDLEFISDYSNRLSQMEKKKKKLIQRLTHLRKVEEKISQREKRIFSEHQEKNRILDQVRNSKSFAMLKLNHLRTKGLKSVVQDESGALDLLFRPSFFEEKGKLSKPTEGVLKQKFGLIRDEDFDVSYNHKGHFYFAKPGAPVFAVFDGRVSFVGDLDGYGRVVILDHGDHYYTVYGNNKNVGVEINQEVKRGQQLASVGTSSWRNSSGLYFEIRHFSEPSDPAVWLKGKSL